MPIARLNQWLLSHGRLCPDTPTLLDGLCALLGEMGWPIVRSNVQIRTLHPEVSMCLYAWRRREVVPEVSPTRSVLENRFVACSAGTVQTYVLSHSAFRNPAYTLSPFAKVADEGQIVHCPIDPAATEREFPILNDLANMGATAYVAIPLNFAVGPRSALSLATDRPGGFGEAFLQQLPQMLDVAALCMELHMSRHITASLLHTYLGVQPGERVMAGQVHCGDVRRIEAAVWFSDLRGFTTLSSALSASDLVATLNDYFGAVAGPVAAHGGEILKYIGDAMLVVFPVRDDRDLPAACHEALAAAAKAGEALAALNRARAQLGHPALQHGIGLHAGEAEYGNIGAPGRLDFTVIGRDVNLASRIESLCGKVGETLLASAAMARLLPERAWRPVGDFELKGIAGQQSVFAPMADHRSQA